MAQCELSTGTFDNWYENYPRKEAKLAAERAYVRARKNGVSHQKLVDGLARFNEYIQKRGTERKYIPLPATWINAGRYDDVYEEQTAGLPMQKVIYWQEKYRRDPTLVPAGIVKLLGLT